MKKYGFLFGAGAELAYNLPSGGKFALDIFRQDPSLSKQKFREMRDAVDPTTAYASDWLPQDYKTRNIGTFGKTVFENIISSTVEHKRNRIIQHVNAFDEIAGRIISRMQGVDVDGAFFQIIHRDVSNTKLSQKIKYNASFEKGNKLFESNYFSSLLLTYKEMNRNESKQFLGRMLLSVMQLQLGALSEELTRDINDNLFQKKDDAIDLFDDFGELIHINYSSAGISGLELLLEKREFDTMTPVGIILSFTQSIIEEIYASVLDYKSLIDSNWHNLYYPNSDWTKFCKISIFLLTVRQYINDLGNAVDISNPLGYYNMLKDVISNGMFEATTIGTTNYNSFIGDILERDDITYLNGSTDVWYDPYLNKIGSESELCSNEKHIIVPLIFTQSGTKPMTSIGMSEKYVDLYRSWKTSDAVVIVGFGFGPDDEHINGILRTLVNDDAMNLIIVTPGQEDQAVTIAREKAKSLKVSDATRIKVIPIDKNGFIGGKRWVDVL